MSRNIFVFGSNAAGAHMGGSARAAVLEHEAIEGIAVGLAGNSYAIPTLNAELQQLPLSIINHYVNQFIDFANLHPDMQFEVAKIGCGIAGFSHTDIAPMFKGSPNNCKLPEEFKEFLQEAA